MTNPTVWSEPPELVTYVWGEKRKYGSNPEETQKRSSDNCPDRHKITRGHSHSINGSQSLVTDPKMEIDFTARRFYRTYEPLRGSPKLAIAPRSMLSKQLERRRKLRAGS